MWKAENGKTIESEMTLQDLQLLVAKGESETVEFKETTGQRGEACRTLCAFLNGNGGTVVFGVSRKGKLIGQMVSDETKKDLARTFCDFEPGVEIPVGYVPIDDTHQAIVCRVESGKRKPYVYDGRPYRRVQSTTTTMAQEQYAAMLAMRGGFQSQWELQWNENVSLSDVDLDEVTRTAKIAIAEGRLSPDVDVNDSKDLLRRFGLLKDGQPLNGAMALFGKNLTFYPQCVLKMAWFKGRDKTVFLDNRMVSGNIIQLQSEAMAFCFKHLNLSGVIRGLYREEELEIPVEALREAIINALAHRLYTNNGGVSLAIYDDRVEISNPGNFSPEVAAQSAFPGMASSPRNPSIAKVLYLRKAIEMWGRGISLILDSCSKARLNPPKIYEDHGFIYTVFTRPTAQEWKDKVGEGNRNGNEGDSSVEDGKAIQTTDKNADKSDEVIQSADELVQTDGKLAQKRREVTQTLERLLPSLRKDARTNAERVLLAIAMDPHETIAEMSVRISMPQQTIKNALGLLRDKGIICRIGGDFGGYWTINWHQNR